MKIITLMENTACDSGLQCEHGLSLYIETGSYKLLFDAGQSEAFADNAQKLGIDLCQVDFAILSHGHYDHSGGLLRFLEINQTAPVLLRREAFEHHGNAAGKDIGIDPRLGSTGRLVFTADIQEIAPGLTLYSGNGRERPYFADTCGQTAGGREDAYAHEQYLVIEENGKRVCISGCSHKGILNILHWFTPDILVGGFHFMKLPPQGEALKAAAEALVKAKTTYYTGHCTGEEQFRVLKAHLEGRLNRICAGTVLEL